MYTRCPHCATVYRVTPQQLQASSGQVKCGRCQAQFDAFATLASARPAAPGEKQSPLPPAPVPPASAPPVATPSASQPPVSPSQPPAWQPLRPSAGAPAATLDATRANAPPSPPAPDSVAAYVHRYGRPRAEDDLADDVEDSAPELEDIEAAPAPMSSVDQFADSLRVLQTVARLSLDIDEPRPRSLADQPWIDSATQTPGEAARDRPMRPQDEREPPATIAAREDEASVTPSLAMASMEVGVEADAGAQGRRDEGVRENADDVTLDENVQPQPEAEEEVVMAAPPPPLREPVQPVLTVPDALLEAGPAPVRRRGAWLAAIGTLCIALLVQGLWWFASPVARVLPGARPALESACALLGCEVAFPQMPDQLFIEGSDLQLLDVARPYEVMLTAQVRNRAALAQQLPSIELTLTNTSNQVVGRRVLRPDEYLDPAQRGRRSIQGNEEIGIRLYLNTGEVRAAGYRLYLFFG